MSKNSRRIAASNILTPLAKDVDRERRLIEAGKSFEQHHKEALEHGRDELRRSGILPEDWKPNETNADHGYWDAWSEQLRKVARELEDAGEPAIAGQLLTFCRQIDDRDEVTCNSDFRFEKLDEFLSAVMAGDKKEVSGDRTPANTAPDALQDDPVPEPVGNTDAETGRLYAVLGKEDARIIRMASDTAKTVERRMMEIVVIDRRFLGKNSEEWATLLDCSGAAIRKKPAKGESFWQMIQASPEKALRHAIVETRPV